MLSEKVTFILSERRRMILLGAAILAAIVAVLLFLKPDAKQKLALEHKDKLLVSITSGDGEIVLEDALIEEVVDFYDDETPRSEPAAASQKNVSAQKTGGAAASVSSGESKKAAKTVVEGIGVLTIDKINLKLPVAYGASESSLKVAAGWVSETASIGGEGNAVIAGHRSYKRGHFFNRLGELSVGDIIGYVDKAGNEMSFEVFETLEVMPGDQSAFAQPKGERQLTLLTCTPVRSATQRLLVRAKRID